MEIDEIIIHEMNRQTFSIISSDNDNIRNNDKDNRNDGNTTKNVTNTKINKCFVEDEEDENRPTGSSSDLADVHWLKSARTWTAVFSALGYTFFYLLRVNMSLALVFMVEDHHNSSTIPTILRNDTRTDKDKYLDIFLNSSKDTHPTTTANIPTSLPLSGYDSANVTNVMIISSNIHSNIYSSSLPFIRPSKVLEDQCSGLTTRETLGKINKAEFNWSKEMTGYILSSFFYGYIVTQFPGGWLATRFGTKHIFGGGMLISIVATFLTPLAARTHPYLLIALRTIMGLAHGAGFPSTHVLYSLWFPPLERTRYITFAHAGTMAGAIIALSVSGFICDINIDNGWPLIFYIYGSASLVWYVLWNYFVYNSPLEHPRIDPVEKEYIVSKIGPSVYGGIMKHDGVPWSQLLRSLPVWAIIVAHFGNNWANYTILVCIPLFMKDVLKFKTKENGVLSSLPYVLSFFVSIGSGHLADLLIRKQILSTTKTRKLLQILSSVTPAIFLIAIGFINCKDRYWAVFLLCLIVGANSFCRAGFMVNHVDIAPRYAGILFGISNTIATTPGILTPIVVGFLTTEGTREEWVIVFNICAALLVFTCAFYLVFGDGKLQKWATPTNAMITSPTSIISAASGEPINQGEEQKESLVTKM